MNYLQWFFYFASLNRGVEFFTTGEAVKLCNFSRQTTQKYLKRFVKAGYLTKVSRGKYQINLYNDEVSALYIDNYIIEGM